MKRAPIEPPEYIKSAITKHYANKSLPKDLVIKESDIFRGVEGVFTSKNLLAESIIGVYTGEINYKESADNKVLQIYVWGGESVYIDAADSWPGKLNHKWDWPYTNSKRLFKEAGYAKYFANTYVSLTDNIIVQTPRYRTPTLNVKGNVIGIKKGDELTIDYGQEFWRTNSSKPIWDLRGAPVSLMTMILFNSMGAEVLYDLAVTSTLILSPEWERDVDDRVFDVIYK